MQKPALDSRPDAPSSGLLRSAFWTTLAGIALIACTNILFPHSYFFLAWDHHSYFSVPAQTGMAATAALLLVLFCRFPAQLRSPAIPLVLAATMILVSILSFATCLTPFPTIFGDGEGGPLIDDRLRGTVARALMRLFHTTETVPVWLWLQGVAATLFVLTGAIFAVKQDTSAWTRLAIVVLFCTAPIIISAYGHYEGYMLEALMQLVWWIVFLAVSRAKGRRANGLAWAALLLATWLCYRATPMQMVLFGITLYHAVMTAAERFLPRLLQNRLSNFLPLLAGIAAAIPPLFMWPKFILHPEESEGTFALRGEYFWWFAHSQFMNILAVCLPAFLLVLWVLIVAKPWRKPFAAMESTCLLSMVTAFTAGSTLYIRQGLNDEVTRGTLGMMVLLPAILLFLRWIPKNSHRVLALFAVFSLYVHAPKPLIYSGDRYITRCRALWPYDRSAHNNQMSAYVHLGLTIPTYDEHTRNLRLAVFEEGMNTQLPYWQRFKFLNLLYLIAWSYEFDQPERGRPGLSWLIANAPEQILSLCHPGAMFTFRHRNHAYLGIRKDARQIAQTLWAQKKQPIYVDLLRFLDKLDAQTATGRDPYKPDTPLARWKHLHHIEPSFE